MRRRLIVAGLLLLATVATTVRIDHHSMGWVVTGASISSHLGIASGFFREDHGQEKQPTLYSQIPGASHLNHMSAHTWNQLGRWGDSTRANIEAWHSDQKAAIGEGFAIYPTHNLHMLLFAASMDGQRAVANQAAKDYTRLDVQRQNSVTPIWLGERRGEPVLGR